MLTRFAEEVLAVIRVGFVNSVLIEILGHDSISIKVQHIERELRIIRSLSQVDTPIYYLRCSIQRVFL